MVVGLCAIVFSTLIPFLPFELVTDSAAEVKELEATLKRAGVPTDADSLVKFFRNRTLSESDQQRLIKAIRRLGDDSFDVREQASAELCRAGWSATRYLLLGTTDSDPEIARRCERCLEIVRRGPGAYVAAAAARLLAIRQPAGALDSLLAYLPFAPDDFATETVLAALVDLGFVDGRPKSIWERTVDDPEISRRSAAARVLGLSSDPAHRSLVQQLANDASFAVRLEACRALLRTGDRTAIPSLFILLTDAPPPQAWEAEELLSHIAGETGPGVHLDVMDISKRQQCRSAWTAWWQRNESVLSSISPAGAARTNLESRMLGLTLIVDLDKGRIVEVGRDHHERWHVEGLGGPVDAQLLPNGRILVAENHARRVTEQDRTGKVLWEKTTTAFPASCQRLPSGATFIATYNQLVEITPDGRETLKLPRPDGVYFARKVRNGRIVLVNSTGKIATLDAAGQELSSFETGGIASWSALEILPDGNCLACCSVGQVVEFSPTGKRLWEHNIQSAVCATRLPNGHTLICSSEGRRVVEVDRSGTVVWEHRTEGRPWHVQRR